MKYFILTAFVALASIGLQSCSGCKNTNTPAPDNPYGLPNATQTGANIFACRINGQNWISSTSVLAMGAGIYNDTLRISGSDGKQFFQSFTINLFQNKQQGTIFNLVDTTKGIIDYLADSSCLNSGSWNLIIKAKATLGTINLTKLSGTNEILNGTYNPNTIVSGTFNCIIPIPNCDTLKVTDGRFDINYSQY